MLVFVRLSQTVHGALLGGSLVVTSYQVVFLPEAKKMAPSLGHLSPDYFRIPLNCIDRLEKETKRPPARPDCFSLLIGSKDGRVLRLLLPEELVDQIIRVITVYGFPSKETQGQLFCFFHKFLPPPHFTGWGVYDIEKEFARQQVLWHGSPSCPWRLSKANENYQLCHAYPPILIVPKNATDDDLAASAGFRAEGRLPVLTWGSSLSSASIWRSSQPKVGVANASCAEDEKIVSLVAQGDGSLVSHHRWIGEHGL